MQSHYSLINYNIYNILPMQGLLIHHTRKPVILCRPMKNMLSIRFYPKDLKQVIANTAKEAAGDGNKNVVGGNGHNNNNNVNNNNNNPNNITITEKDLTTVPTSPIETLTSNPGTALIPYVPQPNSLEMERKIASVQWNQDSITHKTNDLQKNIFDDLNKGLNSIDDVPSPKNTTFSKTNLSTIPASSETSFKNTWFDSTQWLENQLLGLTALSVDGIALMSTTHRNYAPIFNVIIDSERLITIKGPVIADLLHKLFERNLLRLEDSLQKYNDHHAQKIPKSFMLTEYVPTVEFHRLSSGKPTKFIILSPGQISMIKNNFNTETAFLKLDEINTVLMYGEQRHAVAIYKVISGPTIAYGYFTSKKPDNEELSTTQAFMRGGANNSPQMFHVLEKPLIIPEDKIETIENMLSIMTEEEATRLKTMEMGRLYLKQDHVKQKLEDLFETKVIPKLSTYLRVYNGIGISVTDIQTVLSKFEQEQKTNAEHNFKQHYIYNTHQGQKKVDAWMSKIKQKRFYEYEHLKILANNYNEKNNINKVYD